ncbi:MAG: TVP38/TMEM64 family protein, partial [Microcystis panniformis]
MSKTKSGVMILTIICIMATAIGVYLIGGIDSQQLQIWLKQMGIIAPILY